MRRLAVLLSNLSGRLFKTNDFDARFHTKV
jgi:hypothetical protein